MALSVAAIHKKKYLVAGQIMAMSLIQGGPALQFLAPTIAHYIAMGCKDLSPSLKELPDVRQQQLWQKLLDAPSIEEARIFLEDDDYDLRFELGYGKPTTSFTWQTLRELVNGVIMHQLVYSKKAALDQLLDGLNAHNIRDLSEDNVSLSMALFTYQEKETETISATTMRNLLKPKVSPEGSNGRAKEEEIILHWFRFLDDVESNAAFVGKAHATR
jgi:hypothetical protein